MCDTAPGSALPPCRPALEACPVVENRLMGSTMGRLVVSAPRTALGAKPGQFVHLRLEGLDGCILRRPFCIYRSDAQRGQLELAYQVVGMGTRYMATLVPGTPLDLIGPVGNGWTIEPQARRLLLVAGGMGAAPLYQLTQCALSPAQPTYQLPRQTLSAAQPLYQQALSTAPPPSQLPRQSLSVPLQSVEVQVVMGAQSADLLVFRTDFEAIPGLGKLLLCTDDGSEGHHGFVTDLLPPLLAESGFDYVACCGPHAMLRAVASIVCAAGIACEVSLEERMACGLGACLS